MKKRKIKTVIVLFLFFMMDLTRPLSYYLNTEFIFLGILSSGLVFFPPFSIFCAFIFGCLKDSLSGTLPFNCIEFPLVVFFINHAAAVILRYGGMEPLVFSENNFQKNSLFPVIALKFNHVLALFLDFIKNHKKILLVSFFIFIHIAVNNIYYTGMFYPLFSGPGLFFFLHSLCVFFVINKLIAES